MDLRENVVMEQKNFGSELESCLFNAHKDVKTAILSFVGKILNEVLLVLLLLENCLRL